MFTVQFGRKTQVLASLVLSTIISTAAIPLAIAGADKHGPDKKGISAPDGLERGITVAQIHRAATVCHKRLTLDLLEQFTRGVFSIDATQFSVRIDDTGGWSSPQSLGSYADILATKPGFINVRSGIYDKQIISSLPIVRLEPDGKTTVLKEILSPSLKYSLSILPNSMARAALGLKSPEMTSYWFVLPAELPSLQYKEVCENGKFNEYGDTVCASVKVLIGAPASRSAALGKVKLLRRIEKGYYQTAITADLTAYAQCLDTEVLK